MSPGLNCNTGRGLCLPHPSVCASLNSTHLVSHQLCSYRLHPKAESIRHIRLHLCTCLVATMVSDWFRQTLRGYARNCTSPLPCKGPAAPSSGKSIGHLLVTFYGFSVFALRMQAHMLNYTVAGHGCTRGMHGQHAAANIEFQDWHRRTQFAIALHPPPRSQVVHQPG